MTDAFEIEAEAYEGIDVLEIASEELFKHAARVMNSWRDNLRRGEGAGGSHGSPFVNSGEAANDVTVDPPREGELEYVVGGDVIQLLIAEWGRAPGSMPPPEPIEDWMREQLGESDPEPFPVQKHIEEQGIEGFEPARGADEEHRDELSENVADRLSEAVDEEAV